MAAKIAFGFEWSACGSPPRGQCTGLIRNDEPALRCGSWFWMGLAYACYSTAGNNLELTHALVRCSTEIRPRTHRPWLPLTRIFALLDKPAVANPAHSTPPDDRL